MNIKKIILKIQHVLKNSEHERLQNEIAYYKAFTEERLRELEINKQKLAKMKVDFENDLAFKQS